MKQYRLIKNYPLSKDHQTIIDFILKEYGELIVEAGDFGDYRTIKTYNLGLYFNRETIENFPEFWEEIKQPKIIGHTFDGHCLVEGERFYFISRFPKQIGAGSSIAHEGMQFNPKFIYFKDKSNADKYIYQHLPILSALDVHDIFIRQGLAFYSPNFLRELTELTKSKIENKNY